MKTIVYIDGFNLYYRLLQDRPALKWLNILSLVRDVLEPANQVVKVRYFTARVSGRIDADAPRRQQLYLDALSSIPQVEIHFGHFLEKPKYASLYKPVLDKSVRDNDQTFRSWPDVVRIWKTEEKGSDVNLATHLLLDAFQNQFEVAAVLSNDSDLTEPIRMTTTVLKKPVGLLAPVKNPTPDLKTAASFIRHVRVANVARSQFPNPVLLASGVQVFKPATWV